MTGLQLTLLKPSVLWRETENGVLVEHGRRSFEMRGAKIYSVVSRLLPMLDGTRSLEAIRDSVPDPVKLLLDRLFEELSSRSMLTAGGAIPSSLSTVPHEVIRLMQDRCEDWPGALRHWSQSEITIVAPDKLAKRIERYCSDLSVQSTRICAPNCEELGTNGSLLIWLATDMEAAVQAGQLTRAGEVVGGVLRGPLAAMVSGKSEQLQHLPALLNKFPDLDEDLGEIIIAGLCASLAHEALEIQMRPFQGAGADDVQGDELRLFRRDGAIRRLQLDAALLSKGNFDVDRASIADVSIVEPRQAPLFDRDTQLMTWADDHEDLVPYPLFHRSIALSSIGYAEDGDRVVSEWGLTPEEADSRTIKAALLEIAKQHDPQPPTSNCSPIIAESDEVEALRMGAAFGAIHKNGLLNLEARKRVELHEDCDRELSTMVRVARLFDNGRMPQFYVASDGKSDAFVGTAELAGMSATRLATDRDRALYEALGAVLSAAQRGTNVAGFVAPDFEGCGENLSFIPSAALDFRKYGFTVGRVRCG